MIKKAAVERKGPLVVDEIVYDSGIASLKRGKVPVVKLGEDWFTSEMLDAISEALDDMEIAMIDGDGI